MFALASGTGAIAQSSRDGGGELRFCLHSEPKTFDPVMVADDASDTVRYLTGGVLMRLDRSTQKLESRTGDILEGERQRQDDQFSFAIECSFL